MSSVLPVIEGKLACWSCCRKFDENIENFIGRCKICHGLQKFHDLRDTRNTGMMEIQKALEVGDKETMRAFFLYWVYILQSFRYTGEEVESFLRMYIQPPKGKIPPAESIMRKWGPALATTLTAVTARLYGHDTSDIIFPGSDYPGIFSNLVFFDKKQERPMGEISWEVRVEQSEKARVEASEKLNLYRKKLFETPPAKKNLFCEELAFHELAEDYHKKEILAFKIEAIYVRCFP